jgi:hypothetical protein
MAIDPRIALGGRNVELPTPTNQLAQYAQMQQIMSGRDTQQMNAMKMQEAQQDLQDRNALRQLDPGSDDYLKQVSKINPKTGFEFSKLRQEGQTAQLTFADAQRKFVDKIKLELSSNPSDDNVKAFGQDAVIQGLYPQETADRVVQQLLAMPPEQRAQLLSQAGATAGERMQQGTATANREQTAATALAGQQSTAATALAGQGVTMRGQDMTAGTALAGQNITSQGQAIQERTQSLAQQRFDRENDPQFAQRMEAAKTQGRLAATNDIEAKTVLPGVINTAENVVRLVDTMIGKRDDKGNLLKGEKPHRGFANAVGFGFPGARYIPGTPAADFQSYLNQVNGTAFLQAFETLKGGGQITEIEGLKATQAINRMDSSTTEKEFINAARDFQDVVRGAVGRAKDKVKTLDRPSSGGADIESLLNKYK